MLRSHSICRTLAGMKASAESIGRVSGGKLDYLYLLQNGPPSGTTVDSSDGIERNYAIQVISRFIIAHDLTVKGYLSPGAKIISVANPGQSLDSLKLEDLELKGEEYKNGWKMVMFLNQSKRDSSVLDAALLELGARYPQYAYYHVYPGKAASPSLLHPPCLH